MTQLTPFPLGAYIGNPDNSSPANEATFESYYSNFSNLLGAAPAFLDYYVDQRQPVSSWAGNSNWEASSAAASPDAKNATPVIAIPFSSTASGSPSGDQAFQAIAAGQDDSALNGIVQAWASQGFSNLVFRPGWEMNLPGVTYAGSDAQSQADWVSAFQHVYTALHQDAAAAGISVQVAWNPGTTNYSNAEATTSLYPGNSYVDIIAADAYAGIYPYSDDPNTPQYHDWATGGEDATVAQFIANPINREHYWSYPAATKWTNDSSGGHSLSLSNLIQFAEAQGKPFAIPEAGAGNANGGTGVADDAAYPQWLAQQLATAQTAGEKISFVNLWDSNGGGNYQFTQPGDGKPAEAAAWAQYFGASQASVATPAPTPAPTPPVSTGSTPDTLALTVAEDAWQGDAQFTVAINGQTLAGVYTATALNNAGSTQTISIAGNWGAGQKTVGVSFINDAYGGSSSTDRNLYVKQVTYDGQDAAGAPAALDSNGTANFTTPGGATALTLNLAEDAWQGDAQYSVAVDGHVMTPNGTVSALNSQGQSQAVNLQSILSAGTHDLAVSFLNDAYGGSSSTDRNLYVKGISVNGTAVPGSAAALMSNGTDHFQIVVPSS